LAEILTEEVRLVEVFSEVEGEEEEEDIEEEEGLEEDPIVEEVEEGEAYKRL
jgi:hypothetical protein